MASDMAFEKGGWVWFNHPQLTWIPAKVLVGGREDITVEDDEEKLEHTHAANSGLFMPMDESNLQPAPDMVKLGDLHEAALLHNLRLRFQNDDIFTYIGPILVACNPYKAIPMFTPEWVEKYYTASAGSTLEPHVYELANNAYKQMMENNEDQSVVISGESGAGKTEETKLTLQFIAEVAKDPSLAGAGKPPEQLLLMSSPIMEAMGNAKTVRNNNSSRFGKYMQIMFNSKGKIMGGETIKYLLEKSRIITAGGGERNYHVF
jgi:myosin-7